MIIKVNGREHEITVEPGRTLLDVLRYELGLTGTKEGCGTGSCGAEWHILPAPGKRLHDLPLQSRFPDWCP